MKTLDRAYLAAHPVGDQKADVTLSCPVPDDISVPKDPDGAEPKVILQVTADTYENVIEALGGLRETGPDDLVELLLTQVVTKEELDQFPTWQDALPFLLGRGGEVVLPFRTFTMTADHPDGRTAKIAITAPSVAAAAECTMTMTDARVLSNLAISLCPTVEDDRADGLRCR